MIRFRLLSSAAPLHAPSDGRGAGAAPDPDQILRRAQAAELLGVSLRQLDRLAEAGGGPTRTRLGEAAIGYRRRHLLEWLDAQAAGASTASSTVARQRQVQR